VLGVCFAVGALWPSHGIRPWIALILVLASVLCDGLDGAVAVTTNRASAFGAASDKIADRICDVCFVLVIWRCGAPSWLTLLAVLAVLGVEALREIGGRSALVTITVAERPSRAICAVLACGFASISTTADWPASVCAGVLFGLSVIALGQLAVAIRRDARAS
jgi:CDP-diacylglycerol--glycerol-3-phosphate 3-phosphatidyltransferase